MSASRTGQSNNKNRFRPTGEERDDLLTQDEVAARLKVTVRTVVRLQNEGVVPFILLGKSVRFFWPVVVSHLNANFTVCRSLRTASKGGRP